MNHAVNASRENAPLVELIAELRWEPDVPAGGQIQTGGAGPTLIAAQTSGLDEFFMRFGGAVHSSGYSETERLVPSGFPILAHQPVYRFKDKQAGSTQSLYQVGAGLFSANAVPPYESWVQFEPIVRAGITALFSARAQSEAERPLLATSLRYIDAFGPQHTEGRDVASFLGEVLGISIAVPRALSQHLHAGAVAKPFIQMQIPMSEGMLMSIGVGEGLANGKPAIMMDTSVATTLPVPPTVGAVMEALNLAHDAIASTFSELVKPIDHLMPRKVRAPK